MPQLPLFTFPLPQYSPPDGYGWEAGDFSTQSGTTTFNTGIDRRDAFLGVPRCIICGVIGHALQRCHIIPQSETDVVRQKELDFSSILVTKCGTKWSTLKRRDWVPPQAKHSPQHEPRNGLLMCASHHVYFDAYDFFIRFIPSVSKFVFVNYSGNNSLQLYHGKAIALDKRDRHGPFPSLFILHEMRVRGFHPFESIAPDMANDPPWQDWITSDDVFDSASGFFRRSEPPDNGNSSASGQPQPQLQPMAMSEGGARRALALNDDVIAEILSETRAMPSWKACVIEGTNWTGTAEENIQKYISSIGVNDSEFLNSNDC